MFKIIAQSPPVNSRGEINLQFILPLKLSLRGIAPSEPPPWPAPPPPRQLFLRHKDHPGGPDGVRHIGPVPSSLHAACINTPDS